MIYLFTEITFFFFNITVSATCTDNTDDNLTISLRKGF